MDEIKLETPQFSIEPQPYDFSFITSALGMIPLPEGIAIQPIAIVTMEDRVPVEIDPEDGEEPVAGEPITLVHFSNQHTIELSAEQMSALETFIRNAQKIMADAQREIAMAQARNAGSNAGIANEIARKAGLIKLGR